MASGGQRGIVQRLVKVGKLTLKPDDLDPWGVVVVGDKLVITDSESYKVLVYSRHDGMLLSSLDKLESWPRGVCRVSDTEFCLVMKDAIIAIMAVKDSGQISRVKTFHLGPTFDYCHGVALWKDTIVVSGVEYRTTCWCVVSPQDGRPDKLHEVCRGEYVSFLTVKHDMVYISCGAYSDGGVYGFNLLSPRQPPYTYKHEGLTSPRGITVNDMGHLFVCDFFNSSIHHLTQRCQLVAIYKDDVPRQPAAIFWDRGVLYLTYRYSNVIRMYETPQQDTAISAKAKIEVDRKDQKKKRQPVSEKTNEQAKVSQKQEAKISPFRPMISVDPVKQLPERFSETGIQESILMQLSKDLINKNWRFFFRALSVPDTEIEQIEIDYHNAGVWEQIYQLLCRSKVKGILNKTRILDALQRIDRFDLVTKYKQETFPDS